MTSVAPGTINSASAGGGVTVGGIVGSGVSVSLSLNGTPLEPATVKANGTWTAVFPAASLGEGDNTLSASFGGDGAPVEPQTRTIVKDTVAPATPTATPGAGPYNRAQTVELKAEPGAQIHYTNQPVPAQPSTVYSGPISVGSSQTIRALAVDPVGNPSTGLSSFHYTIDTLAPLTPGIDLAATSDTGSSSLDNRTGDSTPTFVGRTEAGATVRLLVNGAVMGSSVANASGNYSITSNTLPGGAHSAAVEASDAVGNISRSSSLGIRVDLVKPVWWAGAPWRTRSVAPSGRT